MGGRAVCAECGREIGLTSKGRLRVHSDYAGRFVGSVSEVFAPPHDPFRCPGGTWEPDELRDEMLAHGLTPREEVRYV